MDSDSGCGHAPGRVTLRRTALVVLGLLLAPATALAAPGAARTHVVYNGQRLGSIAKRYGVSLDALCTANDLRPSDALKPGQRLVIPSRDDRDGSRARVAPHDGPRRRSATEPAAARSHRVEAGQRLDSIARRYGISVDAIRTANHLPVKCVIRPGQMLRIPAPGEDPSAADSSESSEPYMKPAPRRGHLELASYNEHYRGQTFDKKGRLLPAAFEGVSRVLAATGSRPKLDPRLVKLLVGVSDTFGGRPVRIVSGYRTTSYFQDSRHKLSKAVDFSIPGVPNRVIRDYLRTLSNVGVGYYPNSSFVHLDVREYAAYWVDYAGPGEAPRGKHREPAGSEDVHEEEPQDVPDNDAHAALTRSGSSESAATPTESRSAGMAQGTSLVP